MLFFNLIYFIEFIKLFIYCYNINTNFNTTLIFVYYKLLLLFKYFLVTKYFTYNKNLLLENCLLNKKLLNYHFQIENNILNIKITSKTTKNTIIRKFSIISIIGNKTNWIGLGTAKHKKLSIAVKNSYKNAFTNILYFNTKFLNFNFLNLKFKKTKLIMYKHTFINLQSINLSNIFNLLGFFINSKIIGVSSNTTNLLYIFKKLSKFNDYQFNNI